MLPHACPAALPIMMAAVNLEYVSCAPAAALPPVLLLLPPLACVPAVIVDVCWLVPTPLRYRAVC